MTATVRARRSSARSAGSNLFVGISGVAGWIGVLGASALFGVVASRSPAVATVHQVVVLGAVAAIGLSARRPEPILAITVYAGTCDVLWRSTQARGPWEASKYALVFGFAILALRFIRRPRNLTVTIGLILLLIPGAVVGMATLGIVTAREYLVANLAGLVALALGILVCTNLRLSMSEVRGVYLIGLSPAVSIAAIASVALATAEDLDFGTQSNSSAAGGFGPVQVSSVLCFGGLLCLLVLLQRSATVRIRALALATGIWLVGQAILTFSRGGVFSLVLAGACIALAGLTTTGHRTRTVVLAGLLMVVAFQVLSWTGAFTGGASDERFSSTDSTNRTDIALADVDLFWENPVSGVGVGVAKYERDYPIEVNPHTEYSRLLAEHGVFGLVALVILGVLSLRLVRGADGWWRMASTGLVVMSLAQMAHSSTRIGCIALGFALAGLREDRID